MGLSNLVSPVNRRKGTVVKKVNLSQSKTIDSIFNFSVAPVDNLRLHR